MLISSHYLIKLNVSSKFNDLASTFIIQTTFQEYSHIHALGIKYYLVTNAQRGAFCNTFDLIELQFVTKIFVLSFLRCRLTQVLL